MAADTSCQETTSVELVLVPVSIGTARERCAGTGYFLQGSMPVLPAVACPVWSSLSQRPAAAVARACQWISSPEWCVDRGYFGQAGSNPARPTAVGASRRLQAARPRSPGPHSGGHLASIPGGAQIRVTSPGDSSRRSWKSRHVRRASHGLRGRGVAGVASSCVPTISWAASLSARSCSRPIREFGIGGPRRFERRSWATRNSMEVPRSTHRTAAAISTSPTRIRAILSGSNSGIARPTECLARSLGSSVVHRCGTTGPLR